MNTLKFILALSIVVSLVATGSFLVAYVTNLLCTRLICGKTSNGTDKYFIVKLSLSCFFSIITVIIFDALVELSTGVVSTSINRIVLTLSVYVISIILFTYLEPFAKRYLKL